MSGHEGPVLTDENGELSYFYPSCIQCKWRRVHDWHYFYCRDLGDKTKPDFDPYNDGGLVRVWSAPRPHRDCRFLDELGVVNRPKTPIPHTEGTEG